MVSARWPITVTPQRDELLSSWLHRLAYANGVPGRAFARVLGLTPGMWSARLDLKCSITLADHLRQYADITSEQLAAMTMPDGLPKQLFLPLRKLHRRSGSTWLQFCPRCLATDTHPYFRREWRLATRLTCEKHKSRLRDRCTACNQPVAAFDQSALVPHHFCTRCGYDLRRASTYARRCESLTNASMKSLAPICLLKHQSTICSFGDFWKFLSLPASVSRSS
ncbi:TniQ family protein [Agrobacterium sp. LC34]|uniref:TniQ family protein n=1 Tax=Agrobacterium sp. LC34 TaxID=1643810 RepID=UPI001FEFC50C|nr:TniQ family protein [Agrobacterium sp. LC34]